MHPDAEMLDAVRRVGKLSPLARRVNAARIREDERLSDIMKEFILLALEHPERVERILMKHISAEGHAA